MPYISRWEAPAVFHIVTIDEDGVRHEPSDDSVDVYFYHAYKGECPLSYWFCADPGEYDGDIGPYDFDVRAIAKALGMDTPVTDDDKRLLLERAVADFMGGNLNTDGQTRKAISRAILRAGESAANAVPTRS